MVNRSTINTPPVEPSVSPGIQAALARATKSEDEERELLRAIRQRITDRAIQEDIEQNDAARMRALAESVAKEALLVVPPTQRQRLMAEVLAYMAGGYGPLTPLFDTPDTEEIMVNRHDDVWIHLNGLHQRTDVRFRDDDEVVALCQRLATLAGRQFTRKEPILDAILPDGCRLNPVLAGTSLRGTTMTIRRRTKRPTLEEMVAQEMLPRRNERLNRFRPVTVIKLEEMDVMDFLLLCIARRINIVFVGGTASGKTTFMDACLHRVDQRERVIFVEDVAELSEDVVPNIVRLQARRGNSEDVGEVSLQALVESTLRMRPDRIIVGEVRALEGGAFIVAINSGHAGSMTSIHAQTPYAALLRLEGLVRSATGFDDRLSRDFVCAVQLLVQIGLDAEGNRSVQELASVDGFDAATGEYRVTMLYGWQDGYFRPTGAQPSWLAQLAGGIQG